MSMLSQDAGKHFEAFRMETELRIDFLRCTLCCTSFIPQVPVVLTELLLFANMAHCWTPGAASTAFDSKQNQKQ